MVCKRCLVSGKVQGVFYRASTTERANALGVAGYAQNLPDGRVEVLVCGEEARVKELIDWLWQGPRLAMVQGVEVQDADPADAPEGFVNR